MLRFTFAFLTLALLVQTSFAGAIYEITSDQAGKTVTYEVQFGGGFVFEQHTAFDPITKKFVYLRWKRDEKAPQPVGTIWDHDTGRTLEMYKFPDVKHPLPIIPSVEAMKVCPLTNDRNFKVRLHIRYD